MRVFQKKKKKAGKLNIPGSQSGRDTLWKPNILITLARVRLAISCWRT